MSDEETKTQLETARAGGGGFPPTRIGAAENSLPSESVVCCSCKRLITEFHQVLPFMDAYVCTTCIDEHKQQSVPESEITNKSYAPWSLDEVAVLNEYQNSSNFLPFICYARHPLLATPDGFFCRECPQFSLKWTYPWVLNSFWKQL